MNKGQLVESLAREVKMSKAEADRTIRKLLEIISKGIKKDGQVMLAGFGTFRKKTRAARVARNLRTQEPMKIKPSKTVAFKPSATLKGAMN